MFGTCEKLRELDDTQHDMRVRLNDAIIELNKHTNTIKILNDTINDLNGKFNFLLNHLNVCIVEKEIMPSAHEKYEVISREEFGKIELKKVKFLF